jgi:hypothetical protein
MDRVRRERRHAPRVTSSGGSKGAGEWMQEFAEFVVRGGCGVQ